MSSLKQRDFVEAAEAVGVTRWAVILRHLLPQTLTFIVVSASLMIPNFIVVESALSYFKLGVRPPATSWGLMLAELMGVSSDPNSGGAATALQVIWEYWWVWLPGVALVLATSLWIALGESLRRALDPREGL